MALQPNLSDSFNCSCLLPPSLSFREQPKNERLCKKMTNVLKVTSQANFTVATNTLSENGRNQIYLKMQD